MNSNPAIKKMKNLTIELLKSCSVVKFEMVVTITPPNDAIALALLDRHAQVAEIYQNNRGIVLWVGGVEIKIA